MTLDDAALDALFREARSQNKWRDEPVSDEGKGGHSIFAWNLMESMKKVGEVSAGANLFDTVRAGVTQDYPQVPQYGSSTSAGHVKGGDYLLEARSF